MPMAVRTKMHVKRSTSTALDLKKSIATGIKRGMERKKYSISKLAARTGTGRESIRRMLNPKNPAVTLKTVAKAAHVLGLRVELVPDDVSEVLSSSSASIGSMLDKEETGAR